MHWPVEDLGPAQTLWAFKIRSRIILKSFEKSFKIEFFLPPGAGGKVDFPLLYEKSDPLAAGRSDGVHTTPGVRFFTFNFSAVSTFISGFQL